MFLFCGCNLAMSSFFAFLYMQSLIKKDREEQSKPDMLEFFSNLVTAYSDPALKPIQRASNSDECTAPLLASV